MDVNGQTLRVVNCNQSAGLSIAGVLAQDIGVETLTGTNVSPGPGTQGSAAQHMLGQAGTAGMQNAMPACPKVGGAQQLGVV